MNRAITCLSLLLLVQCGSDEPRVWACVLPEGGEPPFASELGCDADFIALASEPLVASIPGARSDKTVIDRGDESTLYFQNSRTYPIHWDFASQNLSGQGLPIVPELGAFNATEYFSPDRRFLLGAVTHYEGSGVWAYEIAPYDTSSAEMIASAFRQIARSAFFGEDLQFHPTSVAVEETARALPDDIPVVTTDELFEGIRYQPLNLAESYGLLRFLRASELETQYVGFRDIVVLDAVPNDISVVSGIITQEFQTPLSHINVLSQNRGTPNMGLRGAFDDPELRALEGKWVRLDVGAQDYVIEETTAEEADAWWEKHRPAGVQIPSIDLSVTDLRDIEDVLDVEGLGLVAAIDAAIPAFGGKAGHFGGVVLIGDAVPHPEAFVVPVFYYRQFMEENGFDAVVDDILADQAARDDPAVRSGRLEALRDAMEAAPVNAEFEAALMAKIEDKWPDGRPVRFRSSTNAEDLDGFTGAGLYESHTGDPDDPMRPVLEAVREVWSSVWLFRAYEEREYRSIDHHAVAMALLVNPSYPDEEANGVAVTANLFDRTGLEPAFYVNVQVGEESVVQPPRGVTTDEFLYYYEQPGQPIVFLAHSSLLPDGESVLTRNQTQELGIALNAIHEYFATAYGPTAEEPRAYYAMDIEFKFDGDGTRQEAPLSVKQARPYRGRGTE